MSDAERYARQIAEANTTSARRLADESRRRWSGVQADDGPFGKVWTDKSGHVIRGAAGGGMSFAGALGRVTSDTDFTAGSTHAVGFTNTVDPGGAVTTPTTAWAYTVTADTEGFYAATVNLTFGIFGGGISASDANDSTELTLFLGGKPFRANDRGIARSSPLFPMYTLSISVGMVDLYVGDTVTAQLLYSPDGSSATSITIMSGSAISVWKMADWFGTYS
jgi:hypothetical protein